jgi:ubiquinone/menaquinone biosynthesis C-methylase UbiE
MYQPINSTQKGNLDLQFGYSAGNALAGLKRNLCDKYSATAESYDLERSKNDRVIAFFESSYSTINFLIGPTSETTIHIDVPVGTGRFSRFLRSRGRRHKILGIDIAPGMIATSQQVSAKDPAMALCFGDSFHLPLRDNSVDLITSLRFFHLFPKRYWPSILSEMRRVLRPGGMLIADLRNVFRGGIWAVMKEYRDRWFHNDQKHSFVAPHEISTIFAGWINLRTRGVGLDGALLLNAMLPDISKRLEAFGSTSTLRYFMKELIVSARKPPL